MATSSRLKRSAKAVKAVFTRGCEPSASTHASAVSHQLGNRGGACTFYTVLLSQESSTAGGRRFGENSSLLHASRTLPRPSYQAWSGARWKRSSCTCPCVYARSPPTAFILKQSS